MAGLTTSINMMKRWSGASSTVMQAVQNASNRTGVSFDYLMNKAKQESSFKADAKAGTSSATGLFQFIESTWLQAVKSYGDQFGLGHLSDQISTAKGGKLNVADAAVKQKILELRNDPTTASNMVAAMTKDNADYLQNSLGGPVGQNDLYLAHFLGLGGANKFLHARQTNPNAAAADFFPAAAKANKNVFYEANGGKRSLDDVYNFFAKKFDGGAISIDSVIGNPVNAVAANDAPVLPPVRSMAFLESGGHDGLLLSADVAASQGLDMRRWGQREILEMLTSGMDNYGSKDKENKIGNNLISPYTSLVLAQLSSPGETSKFNDGSEDKLSGLLG